MTTARIRGIGTVGDNAGLESSVGVVIDGVYRPRNGVGFGDLGELERIEVLKGPQGTVFGKNTSAGVINVITRRPQLRAPRSKASSPSATTTRSACPARFNDCARRERRVPHLRRQAQARRLHRRATPAPARAPRPRTATRTSTRCAASCCWSRPTTLDINFIADFTSREENCCVGVHHGARRDRGASSTPVAGRRRGAGGRSVRPRRLQQPQHRAGHQGQGRLRRGQLDHAVVRRRDPDLDHRLARLGARSTASTSTSPAPTCCTATPSEDESLTGVRDLQPGVPPDRLDRPHRLDGRRVLFRRGPRPQRDLPHRRRPTSRTCQRGPALLARLINPALAPQSPNPRRCSCRRSAGVPFGTQLRRLRRATTTTTRTPRAWRCSPTTPGTRPTRST